MVTTPDNRCQCGDDCTDSENTDRHTKDVSGLGLLAEVFKIVAVDYLSRNKYADKVMAYLPTVFKAPEAEQEVLEEQEASQVQPPAAQTPVQRKHLTSFERGPNPTNEVCLNCGKHIRHHFGGTNLFPIYRCQPCDCDCHPAQSGPCPKCAENHLPEEGDVRVAEPVKVIRAPKRVRKCNHPTVAARVLGTEFADGKQSVWVQVSCTSCRKTWPSELVRSEHR
jgi:hypothetical protein